MGGFLFSPGFMMNMQFFVSFLVWQSSLDHLTEEERSGCNAYFILAYTVKPV